MCVCEAEEEGRRREKHVYVELVKSECGVERLTAITARDRMCRRDCN